MKDKDRSRILQFLESNEAKEN